MPLRSDWSAEICPIARGIDAIGDPWTLLILREAVSGARRFDDFKRRIAASDNVLAARLATMVDEGLLETRPYSEGARPRQEYVPTEAGADAVPVLQAYATWAHRHRPSQAEQPSFAVVCGACGATTERSETCAACGAALTVAEGVKWRRPGPNRGEPVTLSAS